MGRSGGKEAKGKRRGSVGGGFPLFPDITDDDFKRGISSEMTILESENPRPKLSLTTSVPVGTCHLTAPHVNYPREEVLPQGTPPRLGREGNSPSVSCQWCLGSWHPLPPCCVFTQLQRPGQPSKGGRGNRDEINYPPPPPPTSALSSIRKPPLPKC